MKISVVGSINMDMTVTAERIPKKGETLHGENLYYIPGGKGANQAVAMARLGADVEMYGCVGNDANGKQLVENLQKEGVGCSHIRVIDGKPTGVALITVGDNDNTIVIVAGANGCVDRPYIDSIADSLAESDLVVMQHEMPIDSVEYIVDFCKEKGIKVILNPAPASPLAKSTIENVTYLTPNEHETKIIFGHKPIEELLKKYPEKLIITLGAKGVACCLSNGEIVIMPPRKAKVVDTTGAGDTLNGALAVCLAEGIPLVEALHFANVAASLSIEKLGAQGGMPTKAEVLKELE